MEENTEMENTARKRWLKLQETVQDRGKIAGFTGDEYSLTCFSTEGNVKKTW